jgi:hypothetical protein
VILPGQGHVEGLHVDDSGRLKLLEVGDYRASGVLALPLQADLLLQARVGCGTVECHLCALTQLHWGGNGGCSGLI